MNAHARLSVDAGSYRRYRLVIVSEKPSIGKAYEKPRSLGVP